MATLKIGEQVREIRFTAADLDQAERQIIKNGGRAITDVLGNHGALFSKYELEWLLWGAWRHKLSTERLTMLMAQFYGEGGTIFDLQSAVVEAMLDTGLYGKRRELTDDAAPLTPMDPPMAGEESA
jgi:hypothetical protein